MLILINILMFQHGSASHLIINYCRRSDETARNPSESGGDGKHDYMKIFSYRPLYKQLINLRFYRSIVRIAVSVSCWRNENWKSVSQGMHWTYKRKGSTQSFATGPWISIRLGKLEGMLEKKLEYWRKKTLCRREKNS